MNESHISFCVGWRTPIRHWDDCVCVSQHAQRTPRIYHIDTRVKKERNPRQILVHFINRTNFFAFTLWTNEKAFVWAISRAHDLFSLEFILIEHWEQCRSVRDVYSFTLEEWCFDSAANQVLPLDSSHISINAVLPKCNSSVASANANAQWPLQSESHLFKFSKLQMRNDCSNLMHIQVNRKHHKIASVPCLFGLFFIFRRSLLFLNRGLPFYS